MHSIEMTLQVLLLKWIRDARVLGLATGGLFSLTSWLPADWMGSARAASKCLGSLCVPYQPVAQSRRNGPSVNKPSCKVLCKK